jgi:methylenetetrahydrofolate reductase (NADPH)
MTGTVRELLQTEQPTWSFEFFPPKDDAGEAQLWTALRQLEQLRPSFVSAPTVPAAPPARAPCR